MPRTQKGVWDKKTGTRRDTPTSTYLSHSAGLAFYFSDFPAPIQEDRGGRERPPPRKAGGHVTPIAALVGHASIRPHGGRSRPYLSLREGPEQRSAGPLK